MNYWSDYNGTDTNEDGIGDTPYVINQDNLDNSPLMNQVDIGIIPEFPSWTILPLFLITTLVIITNPKRLRKNITCDLNHYLEKEKVSMQFFMYIA
jgi:hypothetical protein